MSDFQFYRLLKNQKNLIPLGITCKDWMTVREKFKERGRSETEQVVVLYEGRIYAVERRDGRGFAMVDQDRQSSEDEFWYPEWDKRVQDIRDEQGLDDDTL